MVTTIDDAVALVREICLLPGNDQFFVETDQMAEEAGLIDAVRTRDSPALYEWLMVNFSLQGISDRIAFDYIERHGNATWATVEAALADHPCPCPKLGSFESYRDCGYRKGLRTCRNPTDLPTCPVPTLPLRKGDLNQQAFSLYYFIRDRAHGDLVGFIDQVLASTTTDANSPDPIKAKRRALVTEFSAIHAVSSKLIAMTLSGLLMSGDADRKDWVEVGRSMVAIDSLVHNFLHRTGTLVAFDRVHRYGTICYGSKGCAGVIDDLADRIDATEVNPSFPKTFPRFVQSAIWAFCAEPRRDICNGRRIDDRVPCTRTDCPVGDKCSRIPLRPPSPPETPSSADSSDPPFRGPSRLGSRRPRRRRSGVRPLRQGHLDGLCGIYAIINGIRRVLGPDPRLSSEVWDELFAKLLSAHDRGLGASAVVTDGIGPRALRRLAKAAAIYMTDHHGIDLIVSRPDHRGKTRTVRELLSYVSTATRQPGSAVVIGFGGKLDHWSVVTSVGTEFITLFDSAGYHRLRIDRCRDGNHPRKVKRTSHVLDPRWLVQITAPRLAGSKTE